MNKIYVSKITNIKFKDIRTGEITEEWDYDECKYLSLEIEALPELVSPSYSVKIDTTEEE
jgi:hypothetical protein